MKKIVTVLCVAALMACMTGCGCGTMVDDGGTSVESTTRRETSTEHYNETSHNGTTEHYNETSHNGTTEYYDSTTHSDGVLNEIGSDIEHGVDNIVGTTEETTSGTRNR